MVYPKGLIHMRNTLNIYLVLVLCILSMGMSRRGQYDEETRDVEKLQKNYEKSD